MYHKKQQAIYFLSEKLFVADRLAQLERLNAPPLVGNPLHQSLMRSISSCSKSLCLVGSFWPHYTASKHLVHPHFCQTTWCTGATDGVLSHASASGVLLDLWKCVCKLKCRRLRLACTYASAPCSPSVSCLAQQMTFLPVTRWLMRKKMEGQQRHRSHTTAGREPRGGGGGGGGVWD